MPRLTKYAILPLLVAVLVFPSTQPVVSQTKKNTAYAVLVDNTASLRKNLPQVRMLGQAVAKHLHQRGPILLLDFKLNLNSKFFGIYDRMTLPKDATMNEPQASSKLIGPKMKRR